MSGYPTNQELRLLDAEIWKVFRSEQTSFSALSHTFDMRTSSVTEKLWSSVPCPDCGVPAGYRWLLYSGGLRNDAHVNRKLAAVEILERKQRRRNHRLRVVPTVVRRIAD